MLADPLLNVGEGQQRLLGRRVTVQDFGAEPSKRLSGWTSSAPQPSTITTFGPPIFDEPSIPSRGSILTGVAQTVPDDAFATITVAERTRLRAEFDDLYRTQAALIEAAAKERVVEAAKRELASREEASAASSALFIPTGAVGAEIMALEGEILQETVLAEQLQASEASREAQLREQSRSRAIGRPPKPNDRSPEADRQGDSASNETQQERIALRQLEQRAWRAQNAVRASEAHEDLLQAHRKDLERKLREVQAETDELSSAARNAAAEGKQLPALEQWEAGLAERVRQGAEAEFAARQAMESLQNKVLDLENECGELWLDITLSGNRKSSEALQLSASLRAALAIPEQAQPLSVDQLLKQLEAQREERQTDLKYGSGLLQVRDEEYCDLLEGELRDISEEASTQSEQAESLKAELVFGSRAIKDAEDRLAEAASLRRENDVVRRQQQIWHTSQCRMLRLIEDMQRQRVRDVQSQATVAARLAELQRELPLQDLSNGIGKNERTSAPSYPSSRSPSPPKSFGSPGDPNFPARGPSRLNALWSDNVALKSQLRKLEEEKDELIRNQEGLIRLVKSKIPTSDQARESLRLSSHGMAKQNLVARDAYNLRAVF